MDKNLIAHFFFENFTDCYQDNDPITNNEAETAIEFESRWKKVKKCFEQFIDIDKIEGLTPDSGMQNQQFFS